MTDGNSIDEIVHRHAKAIVSMDIAQIMNDLETERDDEAPATGRRGSAIQIMDTRCSAANLRR